MTRRDLVLAVLAVIVGIAIAAIDASPRFDDTGVSGVALFAAAGVAAAASGRAPIVWGLFVGLPLPVLEIVQGGNFGSALALVFALAGAAAGWLLRGLLVSASHPRT
jgi:hypothetical protein